MESFPPAVLRRELGFNRSIGFNCKTELTKLTWEEQDRMIVSPRNPIYSMEFCPITTQPKILAVSDEVGGVTLIDTQTKSKSKIVSYHQCHKSSLYSVTWSVPHPNYIATGASDQTVCVWDANSFKSLATFTGHSKTVRRVRFHPTRANMVGSGSRDGSILLWDIRSGSTSAPDNEINCAHSRPAPNTDKWSPIPGGRKGTNKHKKPQTPNPVTDFLFVDDNILVSCGATDGQIKFWDIRKTYKYLQKVEPVRYLEYKVVNSIGFSAMAIDDIGNFYVSTAMDDIIRFKIYSDAEVPDAIYKRPRSDYSVSIGLSSDGRYLISGSVTPFACLWDTWDKTTGLPFAQLEGTRKECYSSPCALFSPNEPMKIVTGADDSTLTIWRFNPDGNTGPTAYNGDTSAEIVMAPFNSVQLPKLHPIILKQKRPPPISTGDSNLTDLPNFIMDGQLPHLSQHGRKTGTKVHTWLANFSKPKPSTVPIKKTIKLKRKVVPSSGPPVETSPLNKTITQQQRSGPPKKRQRQCPGISGSARKGSRRNSTGAAGPGRENDGSDTESPSILKYFSPVPSPLSTGGGGTPLREMDNSSLLDPTGIIE